MKSLPIGIQTFGKIMDGNYVYVDKTEYLYKLIRGGTTYFLSRPRRFGKSLTLSTLEAIFLGKKELFKGLWIEKSDYDWKTYPVIRLDMSGVDTNDDFKLTEDLKKRLHSMGKEYGVHVDVKQSLKSAFIDTIRGLSEKAGQKVVVLVDEYDKPILDRITDLEKANKNRELLRDFYGVLKSEDEHIRFIFLTGVTKFSKVSVFSGLNNLRDISMSVEYSTMLGYTQEELENSFKEHIDFFCQTQNKRKSELLEEIRVWYNGFRFSEKDLKVYNPFSTLLLLKELKFRNYWFETATPTFLIDLIKKNKYSIYDAEEDIVREDTFSIFEVEQISILALLFQTGYFTIKEYYEEMMKYRLGYPNKEVEISFTNSLLAMLRDEMPQVVDNDLSFMAESLYEEKVANFFERFKTFIASMPYTIRSKDEEKYYQGLFYTILRCLGINVFVEVTTNRGRIDAVIKVRNKVYIIEFKLEGTKEEALAQIKEKGYADKYKGKNKEIILVGAEINRQEKNIGEYIVEKL